MATLLEFKAEFRNLASGDVTKYAELLVPETNVNTTRSEKRVISIANAASATLRPDLLFSTKMHTLIVWASGRVVVSDSVSFACGGRFIAVVNDADTTAIAFAGITVTNNSGSTVTVEVLMTGD